ncbi:MAG: 3-dehydroquinate synthase [Promethearchaeota archaeon]
MIPCFEVNTRTRRYPVYVGQNILSETASCLSQSPERVFVITDNIVSELYLAPLLHSFEALGIDHTTLTLAAGEESKTLDTAAMLINSLLESNASRSDVVLALGGGVVGDIAGFAASVVKRGIRLAQVPTSLLAQVDSALGGKTAVNHSLGKNLIGTFYQPHLVVADVRTLRTLPGSDFSDGLAEVVKYAAIMDSQLMTFLLENQEEVLRRNPEILETIVKRCLQLKAHIVEKDETDEGQIRQVLNFGHTVGHAIETCSEHEVSHGQAVSIGMVEEASYAIRMGHLNYDSLELLISVLDTFGLPTEVPSNIDKRELNSVMKHDKKVQQGHIVIPVLVELGRTELKVIDSIY